jgi:hypothetical protein
LEESLWLKNGAIFTAGPGNYKIPGFADIPQKMHVSLLKDAEWPNLGSIRSSKGIGVSSVQICAHMFRVPGPESRFVSRGPRVHRLLAPLRARERGCFSPSADSSPKPLPSHQEPPFFLGCSVFLALRYALKAAREANAAAAAAATAHTDSASEPPLAPLEFRLPLTSERIRLGAGDRLARQGHVEPKEGQKGWFVHI